MAFYANAPLPDLNARQVAQTIRPPSTSLLTIDSEDRFKDYTQQASLIAGDPAALNTTPYYFAISKNESLMNGFFTRVGITEINLPWSIPNVNKKTNTIAVITTGTYASTTLVNIPIGFYTPAELAAQVQASVIAINVALAGFTITFSDVGSPYFTYSTGDAGLFIQFAPVPYNTSGYPYPASTKQLFNLLGFTGLNTLPGFFAGQGGYTFCQFTRYVDICCFQLTNNQALKDQTSQPVARDMLARIYLGNANSPGNISTADANYCPPGCAPFVLYKEFATPKQIQWIPNQPIPGYLVFQLFDDSGAPLTEVVQFPATASPIYATAGTLDWSMTMMVSEN